MKVTEKLNFSDQLKYQLVDETCELLSKLPSFFNEQIYKTHNVLIFLLVKYQNNKANIVLSVYG